MFAIGWGANQFVSLLVAYHQQRGISTGVAQTLFGVYALGLVVALLLGGPYADHRGRAKLVRPAALVSVVASILLMVGSRSVGLLLVGRLLAGIASGAVFAAGTAWVKELSQPPFENGASGHAGARRAALALSAGFGLGPVTTGVIAQWAPEPLVVAYVPHLVLMALVLPGLWRAPETLSAGAMDPRGVLARLRVPSAKHSRFLAVVGPPAPWVFGGPAIAFAVLPTALSAHTKGYGIIFSGVSAGVTLAVGVAVQPLARQLDRVDGARAVSAGVSGTVLGMLLAAASVHLGNPWLSFAADAFLGVGYGFGLVGGLLEVQRLAPPDELARLTAVFYTLTYVGFALPLILAELTGVADYTVLLLVLAGVALFSLAFLRSRSPRHPTVAGRQVA
jgi:predicted MFS family arabinose efflux permease